MAPPCPRLVGNPFFFFRPRSRPLAAPPSGAGSDPRRSRAFHLSVDFATRTGNCRPRTLSAGTRLRSQLHEVVGVAFVVPEVHVVNLAVPAVAAEPMNRKAARPALEGRTFL